MGNKLLVYIGENQFFNLESTIECILTISGVTNARRGNFFGDVFECNYTYGNRTTVVRISEHLNAITIEGNGIEAIDFAVQFQKSLQIALHIIDMNYSFDFNLSEFKTSAELMTAINNS